MTVLIAANYFMLSEHTRYQSKSDALEMDAINNFASDVRHVIVLDKNNAVTDAMADAAFFAINRTQNGVHPSALKNRLDPIHSQSETFYSNMTKWFLNYTKLTLLSMNKSYILPLNISNISVNKFSATTGWRFLGGPADTLFYGQYTYSFSYVLFSNSSFEVNVNQTIVLNKYLEIIRHTSGYVYCIKIINIENNIVEFYEEVACNGWCVPRTRTASCQ